MFQLFMLQAGASQPIPQKWEWIFIGNFILKYKDPPPHMNITADLLHLIPFKL